MFDRSPLHQQIAAVPDLLRTVVHPLDELARATFDFELCTSLKQVSLVGCGDSFHASIGAELAFKQLAGIQARAYPALTFSRYEASFLVGSRPKTEAVIATSVSGGVARTVEALRLGQSAGAEGIALTASSSSPLAQVAERVFEIQIPPLAPQGEPTPVPGVRSYAASQLALYLAAIRIGEVRGHLTTTKADSLRAELLALAEVAEATIAACATPARDIVSAWGAPPTLVYLGAGPLYGTALFSAAKMVEASGLNASGQETEEWAHVQFFAEPPATPTLLLDACGHSTGRAAEVAAAATTIGRHVVAIVSPNNTAVAAHAAAALPVTDQVRECFAPLVYHLPGALLAAEQAAALNARYYRDFGGGRADIGYDVRGSQQITEPPGIAP